MTTVWMDGASGASTGVVSGAGAPGVPGWPGVAGVVGAGCPVAGVSAARISTVVRRDGPSAPSRTRKVP